jgi:hypothetical protein
MDVTDTSSVEQRTAVKCLGELGLSAAEQAALARQGFVTRERRGQRSTIYKLRFRFAGRQRVRYLGTDPTAVDQVREALTVLQAKRQLELESKRLHREATELLRGSKLLLGGPLAAAGYRFHGLAVRQPRVRETMET